MKKICSKLTEDQAKHYESIKWLLNPGPRGAGRTYLMALCFIDIALNTGQRVRVFDHSHYRGTQSKEDMIRMISSIVEQMDDIELVIIHHSYEIEVMYKPTIENTKYEHHISIPFE